MSFFYPAWLAVLVLVPFLILVVIITRKNKAKIWAAFVSSQHQTNLVTKYNPLKFWLSLSFSLLGISCIIIAVSRPYAGKSITREKIQSRNILIAMDTSLSMLCEDVHPNRLSSGVTFAVNLIDSLPNDHFGIMAYAGSPNVITSFTIDHPSIKAELANLGPRSTHIAGSNLTDALYEGISTLRQVGKQANALILITDGTENLAEINEIIAIAKTSYVQIFTIGVGSLSGGSIPINNQLHRDTQGNVVITKLHEEVLRQLARDTSGVYTHISTQPEEAIANAVHSMSQFEKQGRAIEIPRELYQWFLAPGIFLLLLSALLNTKFKSTYPTALLLLTFFHLSSDLSADETRWIDNISNKYLSNPAKIQAGYKALENKKYQDAINHLSDARVNSQDNAFATLSLAIAQAAYRLGDYELAIKEYSQALASSNTKIQNKAQYNLANSLFKKHTSKLNLPNEGELTQLLEDKIRSRELTNNTLDEVERGLKNAITHYSDTLILQDNQIAAKANIKITEQIVQAIHQARKTATKSQQEEKPEENQEDSDNNNDSDKNKADDSDQHEKNQPNDQNKETPEESQPDKKDNQQGQVDKPGKDSNEQPDSNKKQDTNNPEKKETPDKSSDHNQQQPTKQSPNDSEETSPDQEQQSPTQEPQEENSPSEFKNKKEALEFLKKHADSRKRPPTNRRNYFKRPTIDW